MVGSLLLPGSRFYENPKSIPVGKCDWNWSMADWANTDNVARTSPMGCVLLDDRRHCRADVHFACATERVAVKLNSGV